jgi:acyl-[acyl-carrier-protein]-phospholipid O-acyltransferase/long-chain-fatty-acid--[acyl-carrier-protein] ligase
MFSRSDTDLVLPRRFLRMCRRNLRRWKMADSSGATLSGAGLLAGSLAVRRLLRREVLAADERFVGVLLPPSLGAALVNAALAIDRRIAVNLNYTLSADVLNGCIAQCGIRHVLTSPRLVERFPLALEAEMVHVERLRERLTWRDKLAAAAQTWLAPAALLERLLGLQALGPDDLATVMFTSGSTGQPKGVMLSQRNIASNMDAFGVVLQLSRHDVLVGVLPVFHSFGYTTTLWTALTMDPRAVYHYTPLEAREVGRLCREHGATILVVAPTFLRSYLRRCEADDFRSLEVVVAGAERLPSELADAFEQRFGVRPIEGYGATELAPVVAVNAPPGRDPSGGRNRREGSVGHPLAGLSLRVVHPDTGADLPAGSEGILLVHGDNVMQGYLGRADLTAEVLRDGWYSTGDMAKIDADGFLWITGRRSRFSKIGGEMVPHVRIEELIGEIIGAGAAARETGPSPPAGASGQPTDSPRVAVAAVPDEKKGERLVVLHCGLGLAPEEVCRRLLEKGLPPLWVPSPDSFREVPAIPLLGTGKLDLGGLQALARAEFGCEVAVAQR